MGFRGAVAAETSKLGSLPGARLAAAGTPLAAAALLAALAGAGTGPVDGEVLLRQALPYLQCGLVLLAVLVSGQEYEGRQVATSLVAMPQRGALQGAKVCALVAAAVPAATATVGAAHLTAWAVGAARGVPVVAPDPGRTLGAVGYLVALCLLAHAAATLLRGAVPALVAVLSLTLIVSPLLGAATEHARWLPDRAAWQLLQPDDRVLGPAGGAMVALAWVAAVWLLGVLRFVRSDA